MSSLVSGGNVAAPDSTAMRTPVMNRSNGTGHNHQTGKKRPLETANPEEEDPYEKRVCPTEFANNTVILSGDSIRSMMVPSTAILLSMVPTKAVAPILPPLLEQQQQQQQPYQQRVLNHIENNAKENAAVEFQFVHHHHNNNIISNRISMSPLVGGDGSMLVEPSNAMPVAKTTTTTTTTTPTPARQLPGRQTLPTNIYPTNHQNPKQANASQLTNNKNEFDLWHWVDPILHTHHLCRTKDREQHQPTGWNTSSSSYFTSIRLVRHLQLALPILVLALVSALAPFSPFSYHHFQYQQRIHHARHQHGNYGTYDDWNGREPFRFLSLWRTDSRQKESLSRVAGGALILPDNDTQTPLTLRDVLLDDAAGFHLAMAPAFFGFYGYFGALAAWIEAVEENDNDNKNNDSSSNSRTPTTTRVLLPLKSVAGASAGAMAAVLLAAGIRPTDAAAFCATLTVGKFADFPGLGAVFRGNKFEQLMNEFLLQTTGNNNKKNLVLNLEDSILPVAVSAFDLQTMSGQILTTGSMARAARASASFPGLFQPVGWEDGANDYVFIDGGIADTAGILGLTKTMKALSSSPTNEESDKRKVERVINLCVGKFRQPIPPGPVSFPGQPEVISISIQGLPLPGPWAMKNGPLAFEAARIAMIAALDHPLKRVVQKRDSPSETSNHEKHSHYELIIVA